MTSRLKRKLDNIGVDVSSSKITESFCLIGTPLPSLDKAKDSNEFVPVWKQDVRDEQGRRRLHGAFTGGFSAGYFNTVGSKEGWTPATFKSSRSARAGNKAARPEDFMDEEDLEAQRESQKMVDTSEQMDILGGTQAEVRNRQGPSMPDDDPMAQALADLLPAARDSAGAQLLKKMGWRLGQGVGPRVSYQQLRQQDLASSSIPVSAPLEEAEDDEAQKHTYAPRDTKVIKFTPRDRLFGLGYTPGASLNDLVRDQGQASSGPTLSAGFGLGALNYAEDDDVDVYDASAGHRPLRGLAYDGGDGRKERLTLGSKPERTPLNSRPNVPASASETFHDGRPVLSGYTIAAPVVEDVWFEIPEIPKGWKPNPQGVWTSASAPLPDTNAPLGSRPDAARWKASGMTHAEERGAKLGEAGIATQAPRSVFDYLSLKDRERLQNIKVGDGASALNDAAPLPPSARTIPTIDSSIAQAALHGFQPFSTDPVKHARYTALVRSQAHPTSSVNYTPPPDLKPGQSIDDFNKEMEDYAKAAMIFKPMTGAMANRFTSASIVDTGPKIQEGLHQPTFEAPKEEKSEASLPAAEETPKQNAARMGMYGPLTREVVDWAPARLLCKRFGVKNPRPDVPGGADEDGPSASTNMPPPPTSSSSSWDPASAGISFQPAATPSSAPARTGPRDISNIGLGEDDEQGRDTLTYERPSMDIFKAIFASDDEDSEDEDEKKLAEPAPTPPIPVAAPAKDEDEEMVEGPIDLASFRPQFVSKSKRENVSGGASSSKPVKKKKKEKALVSVDMDVDGELSIMPTKTKKGKKRARDDGEDGHKKKKRAEIVRGDDADEGEWVEKVVSGSVASGASAEPAPTLPPEGDSAAKKGRMRASDFL